jgi:chaperonin GroES
MPLRPLSDKIIVERLASRDRTDGGLYLPDSVKEKEKPQVGRVLAVGPGRKIDRVESHDGELCFLRTPMDVSVGDLVLFTKYGGTEQEVGGLKFVILSEADVLAVIEPELPVAEQTDGTATETG